MINSANDIQREIKVKGQKLGNVTSFKYLGAVVSDHGSKSEILSRIVQATAALTKLKPIWRGNNISLGSKVKLMTVLSWHSHSSVCLWNVDLDNWVREKKVGLWDEMLPNAFEYFLQGPCYQWGGSQKDPRSQYEKHLTVVMKQTLRWFGQVWRASSL